MPAAKAEKVTDIAGVVTELKRKAQNVSLNLETGGFDVTDAKGKVLKTVYPVKGIDAAYVVNRSTIDEDVAQSGEFLKTQRDASGKGASDAETAFAETQDDLIRAVGRWNSTAPGATKVALAIEVGRLQRELATLERRLRDAQYNYREVLPVSVLRKLYAPLSNDERATTYNVYKLAQNLSLSKARSMPLLD